MIKNKFLVGLLALGIIGAGIVSVPMLSGGNSNGGSRTALSVAAGNEASAPGPVTGVNGEGPTHGPVAGMDRKAPVYAPATSVKGKGPMHGPVAGMQGQGPDMNHQGADPQSSPSSDPQSPASSPAIPSSDPQSPASSPAIPSSDPQSPASSDPQPPVSSDPQSSPSSPAMLASTPSGTGPGTYVLQSMPAGTVSLQRDAKGNLDAHAVMFGLTPGSSHIVAIDDPQTTPFRHVAEFGELTADATGQVNTTLVASNVPATLPSGSRVVIRLGVYTSNDFGENAVAEEPIAETDVLPATGSSEANFHGVTFGPDGTTIGQPAGQATITVNIALETLTVTVNASGLNPGPHAAHIHLGSCQSQGKVAYMLPDFIADANGNIVNQTRVATGVTSFPGPGSWYFNLHQGGMNEILNGTTPTLSFRPMLCSNITSVATVGPAPSPTPTPVKSHF